MKHKKIILTEKEIKNEMWKPIPKYENLYEVSNLGRVRTKCGKVTYTKMHGVRHWKSRVLKYKGITPKTGYRVDLWKSGKPKTFLVARLVGFAWIGIPKNKMTINHKNGNRLDNRLNNLEWLTIGNNIRHAFETGLIKTGKKIALMDISFYVNRFNSMAKASQFLGYNNGYISNQLKKGKLHSIIKSKNGQSFMLFMEKE